MAKPPRAVACIRNPNEKQRRLTLCNKPVANRWVFESIDDWWNNANTGRNVLGCAECVDTIKANIDYEMALRVEA